MNEEKVMKNFLYSMRNWKRFQWSYGNYIELKWCQYKRNISNHLWSDENSDIFNTGTGSQYSTNGN